MPRRLASRLTYAVIKMKLARKILVNVTKPARANEASTGLSRSSGGNISYAVLCLTKNKRRAIIAAAPVLTRVARRTGSFRHGASAAVCDHAQHIAARRPADALP